MLFISPINPGTTFTLAFSAIIFDLILSPIEIIAFSDGPINIILFLVSSLTKLGFSDKKPYPG